MDGVLKGKREKSLEKKYKDILSYKDLIKHVSDFDERLKIIKEHAKDFDQELKQHKDKDQKKF